MDAELPLPPPYAVFAEAPVSRQRMVVTCRDGVSVAIDLAEAQLMANALQLHMAQPENVASVPEPMQLYMTAFGKIDFDARLATVRSGSWRLSCAGPMQYAWVKRPVQSVMMTAPLAYDPGKDIWFVTRVQARSIRPRR